MHSQLPRFLVGQIFPSDRGVPHFNALAGVIPGDYPDKLYLSSPETRMIVLPDAENRTIVSLFVWAKHRNVTDGQTKIQPDGICLAITAVCIASNADAL